MGTVARKARDKAGVDAGVSALSDAIRSPMPMPVEHRLQVDIAPTGRPNFNSRRKLADVGDDLKPALDTISTGISGSASGMSQQQAIGQSADNVAKAGVDAGVSAIADAIGGPFG